MKPHQRQDRILEILREREIARTAELAESLGLSTETIRRDLVILEEAGAVCRVYGGVAIARHTHSTEPDRAERALLHRAAKEEIGEVAASLVGEADTLFLDVGTTVEVVAEKLSREFRGYVLTNSIPAILQLAGRSRATLHVLGGRIRSEELTSAGAETAAAVRQFHADRAFLGSGGVHPTNGLTDYDPDDIAVRHAMIESSREVYVLADATKIGHTALRPVCGWDRVTAVITDSRADPKTVESLRAAGVEVLQTPKGPLGDVAPRQPRAKAERASSP